MKYSTPSNDRARRSALCSTSRSVAQKEIFTGRLRHCRRMNRIVDLILSVMAAAAAALLLALIARDDIGMPPDMVRANALISAAVMTAAVAGHLVTQAETVGAAWDASRP
jgi:hypothetical protein